MASADYSFDMAAGNFSEVLGNQGGGRMTGLVVGAKAPIVLTCGSGADESSIQSYYSCSIKVRFLLDVPNEFKDKLCDSKWRGEARGVMTRWRSESDDR